MNSVSEQRSTTTATDRPRAAGGAQRALRIRNRDQDRAVLLSELDAVIDCPPMTSVPSAPAWLLGVAACKGALLPVVDLAAAWGEEGAAGREPGERLLLVETGAHRVAFSVDAILSSVPEPVPTDGSPIALRRLAAKLLGSVSDARLDTAGPAAR